MLDDLPPPPEIAREDLPLKSPSTIYCPPKIAREDLPLKLPSTIYPPPEITRKIYPSNRQVRPKSDIN